MSDTERLEAAAAKLEQRAAGDEAWANACEGLHWEWRGNDLDDLVTPTPLTDEYIDGDSVCSLRSVEEFPYGSIPGTGPRFLIHSAEETLATAAGHIVRHDPARVLAQAVEDRAVAALLRAVASRRAATPLGLAFIPTAALAVADAVLGVPASPKEQTP